MSAKQPAKQPPAGGGGAEGGDMTRLTRGMGLTGTCIPYNIVEGTTCM